MYRGCRSRSAGTGYQSPGVCGSGFWLRHRPNGFRRRTAKVAIARAIAGDPKIILADEPTGNLDTRSGEEIMAIFSELHEKNITLVLVTHDPDIARHAERIVSLRDGKIISDQMVEDRLDAKQILAEMGPSAETA